MNQLTTAPPTFATVADLLDHLGGVPPERVRLRPTPGTATEQDVIDVEARDNRLCELVDGVLVEKTMGFYEARLAMVLGYFLESFLELHDLGIATGADGMVRLSAGQVRIPDVAFVAWRQLPNRELPLEPIPDLAPDLAVEVLSESNTAAEMARKLRDYFGAGVRLVWFIDPDSRTAEVYTAPDHVTRIAEDQALDGGSVLPGFILPLRRLFERAVRQQGR